MYKQSDSNMAVKFCCLVSANIKSVIESLLLLLDLGTGSTANFQVLTQQFTYCLLYQYKYQHNCNNKIE